MMTTQDPEATPTGIFWRGRVRRFAGAAIDAPTDPASLRIDRQLREHFPNEIRDLDQALERGQARLQRDLKTLTRGDGSPVFAPAEQQERAVAIRSAVAAEFDLVGERIKSIAADAIEQARTELAKLDGEDGWSRLTSDQQQRAGLRREFVREDAELLPAHELVKRGRGALAVDDKAELWLLDRYVGMRVDRERGRVDPEIAKLQREIAERARDPKAGGKRKNLEQRISSAQVLDGRVRLHRSHVDGQHERMVAGMR